MPLWTRIVLTLYGLLCVAALALAVIGSEGLFGFEPDAFAGVFAIALALPWSILLPSFEADTPVFVGILVVCMLLNGGLIAGFGRLLRYWFLPKKQAM